jgi:hypothetical protein
MGSIRKLLTVTLASGLASLLTLAALTTGAPQAEAQAVDAGAVPLFVTRAQRGEVVPPELDEVEQMCALITGCERLPMPIPGDFGTDFAGCVKKLSDDFTKPSGVFYSLLIRECGLEANSCDKLATCALRGASPSACEGKGLRNPVGTCDADGRAVECYQGRILAVRDCPRGDEQCAIARSGKSLCSLGPCGSDWKPGERRCSANRERILECQEGKLSSLHCGLFGLKCVPDGDTVACATNLPSCTGTNVRCDGKYAVGCHRGHEVRVDCSAAGLECNLTPPAGRFPVGACTTPAATGPTCNPSDPSRCEAGSVRYCFAGKPRKYLCKTLLRTCDERDPKQVHCAR